MKNKEFVLELFDRLDQINGKKALQKLVYLARIFDIETSYSYRFHYFGPYSDQLAADLDELIETNAVRTVRGSYALKLNDELRNSNINNIDYSERMNELIEVFGDKSPSDLELYATAYFIDKNEKFVFKNYNEEKIIKEIIKAKPKFGRMKVKKFYNELKNKSYLYNDNISNKN